MRKPNSKLEPTDRSGTIMPNYLTYGTITTLILIVFVFLYKY